MSSLADPSRNLEGVPGVFPRQPILVLMLILLGAVTRLPWMSKVLYHWDSVNFAFAMRAFDMANDQPQPPGYILYVWLTRAVDLIFHDPQHTMVAISVCASILSIVAIYFLASLVLLAGNIGLDDFALHFLSAHQLIGGNSERFVAFSVDKHVDHIHDSC